MSDRASLYDTITQRIIGQLEAGTVPWVQPWQASKAASCASKAADWLLQYAPAEGAA